MSVGHEYGTLQSSTHTPSTQVPFVQPCSHRDGPVGASSIVTAPSTVGLSPGFEQSMPSGIAHQPLWQTWPPVQSAGAEHCTVQSRSSGL